MGCCNSSEAAGEKKGKKGGKKQIIAVPDKVVGINDELIMEKPLKKATYGVKDSETALDVTNKLRALYNTGIKTIAAGELEKVLTKEEPFFEMDQGEQIVSLYYIPETPDGEWEDFDNVKFDTSKTIIAATYGIDEPKDVTAKIIEIVEMIEIVKINKISSSHYLLILYCI